ncbi:Outer membrane receptor proteins, mostly Fe transport [Chitinophaga costaii]|uniref:Outer membrane receptor proteins, mostly Fe transport n=1 Tax=Chitinophaga costaii TaxID=1335309 RepID=A0A1C4CE17_9BACT|nr:outer membrane beta-barrel family protein [Chitinophaga costaii]SCC17370.1 Outer membrane receptor proteins, mostly Fe transport [Chitinophaga costaii]
MKHYLLAGLLLLAGMTLRAQNKQTDNGTVQLAVQDAQGKGLPFVTLLVKKAQDSSLVKGELSTETGHVAVDKLPYGHFFVEASLMGYQTVQTKTFIIDAAHPSARLSNIILLVSTKNLQAVNVVGQKPFIERVGGTTTLNVENSVSGTGSTALEILRKAPGVTIDKDDNILLKGQGGATVMLDGRLTHLSGDQLANLLKNMSSETIASIEIITNPSAKYDAAGSTGIINIKTKKSKLTGLNGSVNATAGKGMYGRYNAGTNINYMTNKLNLFGNYHYTNNHKGTTRALDREVAGDPNDLLFQQRVKEIHHYSSNNYKAGIDYFLTKKQTLGFMFNGYNSQWQNNRPSNTSIRNVGMDIDSVLHSRTTNDEHYKNQTYNLNYKATLDSLGKEITFDGDFARFRNTGLEHLNDSMYNQAQEKYTAINGIRDNTKTSIRIATAKIDATLPFNKTTKLDAGLKMSFVKTDNDLRYDSLRESHYQFAPSQSNQFIYKENVYAAYAMLKHSFKKTDVVVGLRAEQTSATGISPTLTSSFKRSYLDLFPNLSVDQKLDSLHKVGISYSRRINRPQYDQLNPFLFFLDKFLYGSGNPNLMPEYMNKLEAAYTFKDKYILTLGYRHSKSLINEYMSNDTVTKVAYDTQINYDNSDGWDLAVTIPVDITKWWNSSNNANVNHTNYRLKYDPVNHQLLNFSNTNFNYGFNSNNTFTVSKAVKLELSGYYYSKFAEGLWKGKAQYSVNIGAQYVFLDKKATLKLNVQDIFNTQQFIGGTHTPQLNIDIRNSWDSRSASLSFTYRFGKTDVKPIREHRSDEENRVKGN